MIWESKEPDTELEGGHEIKKGMRLTKGMNTVEVCSIQPAWIEVRAFSVG